MKQAHYHPYTPSVGTSVLDTLRKQGFVPPTERPDYQAKFAWFQSRGWTRGEDCPKVSA